ncbi:MAG: hypothetical protein V1695_00810 [Candidatus Uhrbacteria bacterium]
MTTDMKGKCESCWNPHAGQHNRGCPEMIGTAKAKAEWEKGRAFGFADNNIPYWRWNFYSPTFILGYRVGKAEIDRMVDDAAQGNIWGPEY